MALIPKNYARLESGYREKALKIYPRVCGRCSREFVYSNLRELTVHHIDHDHTNNPEDGSNWELLCLFCHDHEHSKYTEADQYGTTVVAGEDAQKTWVSPRLTPCRSQGDDGQEEVISTASLPIPAVWALIFLKHFIKYPFRQICLAAILNITLFLLHPYDVTPRSP